MKKLLLLLFCFCGAIEPIFALPSLSYSTTTVNETATNDGFIDNTTPIIVTLTDDTFKGADGDDFFATGFVYFENIPTGLTPVVMRTSPTELQITFSGHATSHANADDVANVTLHFYDRFTTYTAHEVTNSSQAFSVNFNDSLLIAYDGFDYTAGNAVASNATVGLNGGTGWDTPWRTNSLKGISVASTGLNYQKLLVSGKSAVAMGNGTAGQAQVWRGIPGGFGGAGNTHWVSFLITKNMNTTDAPMRLGLTDSTSPTPAIQAIIMPTPSTGLWATSTVGGYTATFRSGWDKVIAGGTSLVIMRIVVNTSTTISYWINPADYTTVAGLGAADITFTNPAVLSHPYFQFFARTSTSPNAIAFDELRVGDSLSAVTPYDPNAPDLVLTKTSFSVHEADGVDAIGVSLLAAPTADVIVETTCGDPSIVTVSPTQLTFTPSNWATPQSITVTALNDSVLRNKSTTVTLSLNATSAPAYASLGSKQLSLKFGNDDVLALVSEANSINITEGATATLRFKLAAQPLADTVVHAALEPILQPKSARKVLLVGNSYSAGFSPEFQSLIAADPSLSLTFGEAIFGGKNLTNHYDNRLLLYYAGIKSLDGLLDEQAWDCVILQEESVGPTALTPNGTATFLTATKNMTAFITEKMSNGINDNPAVKVYYLMTPAHHENSVYMTGGYSPEVMQKEVRDGYYLVANDPLSPGTVIPVGNAFERAYTQKGYGNLTLHALPDTTHHSIFGKYLGVAVMVQALYQRDLGTNTYLPAGMTQQDVNDLKSVANEIVKLGSPTAYNTDFSISGNSSFTFTPANWDIWQTVTVQAATGSAARLSTAKLRIHGDDLVIDGLSSLIATTSATPIQSWRQTHFGSTNNTGNASDSADPDNDGVNNISEYAFSANPNVASTNVLPTMEINASNLDFSFRKARIATDVTYLIQSTQNLAGAWTDEMALTNATLAGSPYQSDVDSDGKVDLYKVSIPFTGASMFLRLKVSVP